MTLEAPEDTGRTTLKRLAFWTGPAVALGTVVLTELNLHPTGFPAPAFQVLRFVVFWALCNAFLIGVC